MEKNYSENYPKNGWLRGYFVAGGNDTHAALDIKGWRKNFDFLRLRDVALLKLNPQKDEKILDLGCADGCTMTYCGLQGAEVYGVDLDPKGIEFANNLLKEFSLRGEAVCTNANDTGFPNDNFDKVISSDFFEHVTDEDKVGILNEVKRILKPGQPIVIKTPNLNYLKLSLRFKQLKGLLKFQNPAKFVIPHTPGTSDPQHIGLANRKSLDNCLEMAGFQNRQFFYAPLRRFGNSTLVELLSTEIPFVRDYLCEDLFCIAWKPIVASHFPD
jgi:2-polyprenyl-3-methyl-5-hydroxy-6-metoxy-1,4-benzoquinol methylase